MLNGEKMNILSFFVFACLVLGNAFAGERPETQVNVSGLPQPASSSVSDTHDWIRLLESKGHLVNVPGDMIDAWLGEEFGQYVQADEVLYAIKEYNSITFKTVEDLKTEFQQRDRTLPEGHFEELLHRYRAMEIDGGTNKRPTMIDTNGHFLADVDSLREKFAFLPSRWDSSSPANWAKLLEEEGYLANVPQDIIDTYTSGYRFRLDESLMHEVFRAIEMYNHYIEPKTYDQFREDFRVRGELPTDDDIWYCLSNFRDYEIFADQSALSVFKVCQQQIAILNKLSDEEWGLLSQWDREYLLQGQHDLESFQDYLEGQLPRFEIPAFPADFASFYVFNYDFDYQSEGEWPLLLVVDNGKGAWDVEDAQYSDARDNIQFKFVANDGTESLLINTRFAGPFYGIEKDSYHIPPTSGNLYWRYHDFALARDDDTLRGDGEWAGGLAITHGYDATDDIRLIRKMSAPPYLPIEQLGDMNWDLDNYETRAEVWYRERVKYLDNLKKTEALREKMASKLYPEDFYFAWRNSERGRRISELDPDFAPQWALDGQALLKETFTLSNYYTVMENLANRNESYRGYTWRSIAMHSNIISMSTPHPDAPQSVHDRYNEWFASRAKLKKRFEERRAEIAAKRAGTVEETSWEWGKTVKQGNCGRKKGQ